MRLVGGTALALQLGHRKSIDLDLFGEIEFETIQPAKVFDKYGKDLVFIKKYSLKEMLGFYNQKYFDGSAYLVLKSLTYFEDAENDPDVEMLAKVSWDEVKQYILKSVNEYNQSITF